MKSALGKVLVAGLVGGGAFWGTGYASQRIKTLQENTWIAPALLLGVGILLARRGRLASGLGLAGAGGAIGMLQLQMKAAQAAQLAAQTPPPAATAGYDAGRMDSGYHDTPAAGALFGANARSLMAAQAAMGAGGFDAGAGALFGANARSMGVRVGDAMGFEPG